MWLIKNKEGSPLQSTISETIPPIKVEYKPNATGKVEVVATCYRPEPIKSNRTTVEVKEEFLKCPSECQALKDCSCRVNGCESGRFQAFLGNTVLKNENITTKTYTATFIPEKIGTVDVYVDCSKPDKKAEAKIPVTGVPEVKFIGSNFRCVYVSAAAGYSCSIDYSNSYGTVYFVFFLSKTGEIIKKSDTTAVVTGSGKIEASFSCSGLSGNYDVSWQAFSESGLSNPIAWSKSTERVRVTC